MQKIFFNLSTVMNSVKRYTIDFSIDHDKASAIGHILLD